MRDLQEKKLDTYLSPNLGAAKLYPAKNALKQKLVSHIEKKRKPQTYTSKTTPPNQPYTSKRHLNAMAKRAFGVHSGWAHLPTQSEYAY